MSTRPYLNPNWRNAVALGHDLAAAAVSWVLGFLVRFNFDLPAEFAHTMWRDLVWLVPAQGAIFLVAGMYRGLWRYASLADLRRIILSAGFGMVALIAAVVMFRLPNVPRSVIIMYPLLLSLIMGGSRMLYRTLKEGRVLGPVFSDAKPVLVVGAEDGAERLLRELRFNREWRAVGVLDDDPRKQGRLIHGVRVLGGTDLVHEAAQDLGVSHVIFAMPSVAHTVRRKVIDRCTQAGLSVLTVPSVDELVSGKVTLSQIRQVDLDDLLGRDPVVLDNEKLQPLLGGRAVLVTGAGGSIGSELCRQIVRFQPRKLILLELSEFALYSIEQEFQHRFPDIALVCAVGDAKDAGLVAQVLREHQPQVVFHAAAYKHVPLMEEHNAWQAVRNNVLSTWTLASAAKRHGVEKFVLVSTDKAVNPTNVMGASKRLAEMVCQALQEEAGTKFVMVRFGNVLGSTGSVIPKFREQIARGGPVTVTHPEVTRYFMSIPEAAQLVLQAGAMGAGGEIFVLDMGDPVKIADLARDMIRLSGMQEDEISIVFTGLRPGEKLYEELLADEERSLPTPHPKLRIARARLVPPKTLADIHQWLMTELPVTDGEVRETLRHFIPEYISASDSPAEVARRAVAGG
ncbi:MAG: polysaccharide biosynthesis protein [Betaproteobacteria bacterium]|nr:polysaccharide biosynthesis protein [Betaproteobacteria bacterium]